MHYKIAARATVDHCAADWVNAERESERRAKRNSARNLNQYKIDADFGLGIGRQP